MVTLTKGMRKPIAISADKARHIIRNLGFPGQVPVAIECASFLTWELPGFPLDGSEESWESAARFLFETFKAGAQSWRIRWAGRPGLSWTYPQRYQLFFPAM